MRGLEEIMDMNEKEALKSRVKQLEEGVRDLKQQLKDARWENTYLRAQVEERIDW